MMNKQFLYTTLACSALLLGACSSDSDDDDAGGGGGGDITGKLTTSNAEQLPQDLLGAMDNSVESVDVSLEAVAAAAGSGIASVIAKGKSQIAINLQQSSCDNNGTLDFTLSGDDGNIDAGEDLSITANNCSLYGTLLTGSLEVHFNSYDNEGNVDARIEFTGVTQAFDAGDTVTVNGNVNITHTNSGPDYAYGYTFDNLTVNDGTTNARFISGSFTGSETSGANGCQNTLSYNNILVDYSEAEGIVSINTNPTLSSNCYYPSTGKLIITASNATATLDASAGTAEQAELTVVLGGITLPSVLIDWSDI